MVYYTIMSFTILLYMSYKMMLQIIKKLIQTFTYYLVEVTPITLIATSIYKLFEVKFVLAFNIFLLISVFKSFIIE